MIPYTIRYTRLAIEALYRIPRGTAGEVSEAIKALNKDPRPPYSFTIDDLSDTYAMKVSGYFVTYQIMDQTQVIKLLLIEQEQLPLA